MHIDLLGSPVFVLLWQGISNDSRVGIGVGLLARTFEIHERTWINICAPNKNSRHSWNFWNSERLEYHYASY